MIAQQHFRLTRLAALLTTIAAAFPVTGHCAAAGYVEFEIGNVESVAADGSRHPLYKGAEINAGDAISTAADGRAQVRFTDGGYISLQPNTVFRVDEFNYQNRADGEEKGFFSLLKGGFRAITGVIGHLHKNTYRVKTPAATIGIRGTGYNAVLRDDGLFVNVGEGAISLDNNAGMLVVTAGNAAYVANFNTAPTPTTQQSLTPPQGLREPAFTVADRRDSSGNLALLSLPSGSGYGLVYAYLGDTCGDGCLLYGSRGLTGVTATFNGASQLVQYASAAESGSLGPATVSFSATDGIIGWGRWDGNWTGPNTYVNSLVIPGASFHYIVGIPTAVMPTTGSATYSLIGYTMPTDRNGLAGYTVSGTLSANFANSTVGVNMSVANAATTTYTFNNTTTPFTVAAGSTFSGTIATTSSSPSPTYCSGGCTTSVNGLFIGTNAARAGLAYSITDSSAGNYIQGVAAFTRN
jgi:FecR protein